MEWIVLYWETLDKIYSGSSGVKRIRIANSSIIHAFLIAVFVYVLMFRMSLIVLFEYSVYVWYILFWRRQRIISAHALWFESSKVILQSMKCHNYPLYSFYAFGRNFCNNQIRMMLISDSVCCLSWFSHHFLYVRSTAFTFCYILLETVYFISVGQQLHAIRRAMAWLRPHWLCRFILHPPSAKLIQYRK